MIKKKKEQEIITVKSKLEDIIKDKCNIDKIFDAVNRTNLIVIQAYQFLRLYILKLYHDNKEIPIINQDFILQVFNILVIHEGFNC